MKILFVFTGGTISSSSDGEKISLDVNKPYALIEAYKKVNKIDFEYETEEPYLALSENSTGKTLKLLCESVIRYLDSDYDGIVVTHGTDTLQYSAAALSYVVGKNSIPICMVSSNYIIEDARSNGIANLHAAINFIKRGNECGVWVPYKNTGDFVRIHRASRLLQSQAFSDSVYSVNDEYYGYFDESMTFVKNPAYTELEDELCDLSVDGLSEECSSVLKLETYVGMTYPEINDDVKCVLLSSYHSGTINTESQSIKEFCKKAYEKGIPVFITGVSEGVWYESALSFETLHIIPVFKIAPISAYIKLWLLSSQNIDLVKAVKKPLGGDI